jgi:hypothetical protein
VSYTVSVARIITGQFYASFAGSHGWRWINLTDEPITVTLETAGYYNVIGMVK